MKNRKTAHVLTSVLVVLVCVITLGAILLAALPGLTVGWCLIADNGSVMLVDGNSPIVLSNQTKNDKLFDGLSTGDKILVAHDGIDDSYPGGTGAYFVMKLSGGAVSDIPSDVLTQLWELGWGFEGVMSREHAVSYVLGSINCKCELVRASFESNTGAWLITFRGVGDTDEDTIRIYPNEEMELVED